MAIKVFRPYFFDYDTVESPQTAYTCPPEAKFAVVRGIYSSNLTGNITFWIVPPGGTAGATTTAIQLPWNDTAGPAWFYGTAFLLPGDSVQVVALGNNNYYCVNIVEVS